MNEKLLKSMPDPEAATDPHAPEDKTAKRDGQVRAWMRFWFVQAEIHCRAAALIVTYTIGLVLVISAVLLIQQVELASVQKSYVDAAVGGLTALVFIVFGITIPAASAVCLFGNSNFQSRVSADWKFHAVPIFLLVILLCYYVAISVGIVVGPMEEATKAHEARLRAIMLEKRVESFDGPIAYPLK